MQKAPKALGKDGKQLWDQVCTGYEFDEIGSVILQRACECFENMQDAARKLKRDGLTYHDRFGAPRLHPAWRIMHESRESLLKHLRSLNVEPGDIPTIGGGK